MAYINQEQKKARLPQIKKVLKKYGCKGTVGIKDYATLYVKIKEGGLDFIGAAQKQADEYNARTFGEARKLDNYLTWTEHDADRLKRWDEQVANFIEELTAAMKGADWYCDDDAMFDHFDRAFYTKIYIGDWKRPYEIK